MAIPRYPSTAKSSGEDDATHSAEDRRLASHASEHQTADIRQVQSEYREDAESRKNDKMDTGALLPKDMTVRLVRAESANWETFLQALYSLTLTLFGLFLGSWVSAADNHIEFTGLEVVATLAFGAISAALIFIWIVFKIRQGKRGIKVPYNVLDQFAVVDAEQIAAADRHPATRDGAG